MLTTTILAVVGVIGLTMARVIHFKTHVLTYHDPFGDGDMGNLGHTGFSDPTVDATDDDPEHVHAASAGLADAA